MNVFPYSADLRRAARKARHLDGEARENVLFQVATFTLGWLRDLEGGIGRERLCDDLPAAIDRLERELTFSPSGCRPSGQVAANLRRLARFAG